jgi:hypothetical protein
VNATLMGLAFAITNDFDHSAVSEFSFVSEPPAICWQTTDQNFS